MWMILAFLSGNSVRGIHGTTLSSTTMTSALPSQGPVSKPRFIGWPVDML